MKQRLTVALLCTTSSLANQGLRANEKLGLPWLVTSDQACSSVFSPA